MDRNQSERIIISNPKIKVKSVCALCNNGWMSELEIKNIPTIGSMFSDLSITLDRSQQEMIAAWMIKTAIISDSTRSKAAGSHFHRKQDCIAMRESLTIPEHTTVWIGRIVSKHLVALGMDHRSLHPDTLEPYARSAITTMVMSHVVVQAITKRKFLKFNHLDMPVLQLKGQGWKDCLT